ncbi:hypothetical protein L3Q82_002451 [Scortum barcoo]|uniref:Uncharacterized protein n=1 Tax=Scortum barcoo TaxID=214431 RepID=A0ACB8VXY5_9TELE|nr:hypothetical protein L3Q82_002451 [Scortum barcoo]
MAALVVLKRVQTLVITVSVVGCRAQGLRRWEAKSPGQPSADVNALSSSHRPSIIKAEPQSGKKTQVQTSNIGPSLTSQVTEAHERVAQLVGRKCNIKCYINNYAMDCLLDTGAQVSILDRQWVKTYLPDHKLRPLAELMGPKALNVLAVNGEPLPYDGWMEVMVSLPHNSDPNLVIQVPFLVSSMPLVRPLIGFNVVEQLILGTKDGADLLPTLLSQLARLGLLGVKYQPHLTHRSHPCSFEPSENNPQLQQLDVGDSLIEVCHEKAPYVKVPIGNHTKHDVTLPSRTVLGSTESVVKVVQTDELDPVTPSVTPIANGDEPLKTQEDRCSERGSVVEKWDPPVDINHLSKDQQEIVKEMLREESGAFAQDDSDMGCITSLEMSITLIDNTPIQKSYASIPKPSL